MTRLAFLSWNPSCITPESEVSSDVKSLDKPTDGDIWKPKQPTKRKRTSRALTDSLTFDSELAGVSEIVSDKNVAKEFQQQRRELCACVDGEEMGRACDRRWPQRPHSRRIPRSLRPLRRSPRAAPPHWWRRRHWGTHSWFQILPLQLPSKLTPSIHHQVATLLLFIYMW